MTVFRSPALKKNVWWHAADREIAATYRLGRQQLEEAGWTIQAVVVDGKKGLPEVFKGIPVQLCLFHQMKLVGRYLTRQPTGKPEQELLTLAYTLMKTDEKTFTKKLNDWYQKHRRYVEKKKWVLGLNKPKWKHQKTRSAYYSLKRGLPYFFTYQKYPKLNIPPTTNSLEGTFSPLKFRFKVHRGLSKERLFRVISAILKGSE